MNADAADDADFARAAEIGLSSLFSYPLYLALATIKAWLDTDRQLVLPRTSMIEQFLLEL